MLIKWTCTVNNCGADNYTDCTQDIKLVQPAFTAEAAIDIEDLDGQEVECQACREVSEYSLRTVKA